MILVISNIANEAAPAWVNTFPAGAAFLVTGSDFNRSFKASIPVNDFYSSSLTLNGTKIKPSDLSGVIVTISAFSPVEFYYIDPEDRQYVCAEVNSFINYFLSELKCKKLNPPGRKSFSGLSLQKIEWVRIAGSLDIPVEPFRALNGQYEYPEMNDDTKVISCTIIGDEIMEKESDGKVHSYVRKLSKTFSLPYLKCHFSAKDNKKFRLMKIDSVPDISKPEYQQAMLNYFQYTM